MNGKLNGTMQTDTPWGCGESWQMTPKYVKQEITSGHLHYIPT
jgi:hypothetical protein